MTTRKSLGRGLNELGLNALLSSVKTNEPINQEESTSKIKLRYLPVELLRPGKYQPRHGMDQQSLEELASSIRAQGIVQPLVVRPIVAQGSESGYEIIAGERRWRAAQLASLAEIPAVVRDISDEQALALSLIENIQREDLNVMDTALSLQRLIDEFGMTHQDVAEAVGKSRTTITNLLRLLTLHEEVKTMVENGALEMGHARALLTLDAIQQLQVAKTIVKKGLSVRAAENLVRHMQRSSQTPQKYLDPDVVRLQNNLADKLAANVAIQHSKIGKGKLVVYYNSLDELEGILEHIK